MNKRTIRMEPLKEPKKREHVVFAKKPAHNPNFRGEEKIQLVCNLLQMSFNPKEAIASQFSVKITPEIANDNYPLRRKILRQLSKDLNGYYRPYFPAGFTLFSSAKDADQMISLETNVDGVDYKVVVEKTKNVVDLTQVRSTSDENLKVKSFIEVLIKNIIGANNNLVRFDDRSFFNYQNIKRLQGNAYIMPGFSTAAVITESGLFLRVNDKNKFMNGKTALEKLKEIHEAHLNGSFLPHAKEYFQGTSVLAKYGSYRVYRISDITLDKNVENTTIPVKNKDGKPVNESLYNYYKIQYGIEIKDKNQPLLIHKPEVDGLEVIYLIPELCYLTGMDDETREQEGLRRNMVQRTKTNANEKMNNIGKIKDLLFNNEKKNRPHKIIKSNIPSQAPNDIRKEWGIDFKEFCTLQGRELIPPPIIFADNNVEKPDRGRFRQKSIKKKETFLRNDWVCFTPRECRETARSMIHSLIKASQNLGISIEEPEIVAINARNSNDFLNELRKYDEIRGKKIAFIVLDRPTKSYYSSIKHYFYTQIGIPSQCVSSDKKSQNLSYYSNVLNQMVVKVRGELYSIHLHDNLEKNPTMIIGIDSSKVGKGKTKIIMASSFTKAFSRFYTEQQVTDNGEEFQNTIREMLRRALDNFRSKNNNIPPTFVIVYRAGGNDKQKERLYREEVPIFRQMLEGEEPCYEPNYKAQLCYISVNKKTDLKFFQIKGKSLVNPGNGTVVDEQVVHPDHFEFYLQPQYVNQGTATPVQYHCLYDTIKIPLESLENITYKQTYYYWNWPGPIREPAALKFAEVCNSFTSRYLRNEYAQDTLKDTPFYI